MSLTKADLAAIQNIIDTRVPVIVDERVLPMFDQFEVRFEAKLDAKLDKRFDEFETRSEAKLGAKLDKSFDEFETRFESKLSNRFDQFEENLKIQMENGLQEVRDQLSGVQATVNRIEVTVDSIERVQHAELERNDRQDAAINKIRKALHAT